MKRLSVLIPSMALVMLLLVPVASAVAPVISSSEYSAYRDWSDEVHRTSGGSSWVDYPYADQQSMVNGSVVKVDGTLMQDFLDGPYPSHTVSGLSFYTTAEYDVCWLNESMQKQTLHVAEVDLEVTGGQANSYGNIFKTLVSPGLFNDVPEEVTYGVWIEDAAISLTVYNSQTYDYDKIATWSVSAAFAESIYIMAEFSLGAPQYRISDPWNHPSLTAGLWQGVMNDGTYGSDWCSPAIYEYPDTMARDLDVQQWIFSLRSSDTLENRSAMYGYCQSLESKLTSVYVWQQMLLAGTFDSPYVGTVSNGTADLEQGMALAYQAYTGIQSAEAAITDGVTMTLIRGTLEEILGDYHQAILLTDRAVIKDARVEPSFYDSVEEWRAEYIDYYINPYIDDGDQVLAFTAWLVSSNGILLAGTTAALAAVAVIWRNGFAGMAALGAFALAVILWLGGGA